jgi:hypothetical protein
MRRIRPDPRIHRTAYIVIILLLLIRLSFEELGEHPFLELEYSVPGPNTLARLNIALDAATAAGKFTHWLHVASCWAFLAVIGKIWR